MNWLAALLTIPPLTIFLLFVVPLWLILRYRNRNDSPSNLSQQDIDKVVRLTAESELIKQRIATLEAILDKDYPNWRR